MAGWHRGGRRRAGELGLQALPAGRSRPGTGRAAPYRQPASPSAATAAPSGRRCHPQPAAAARARQAARRQRRRPPKATACPLCPSPAALSRASPRPGARDARRVGRAALRRCCCCPPLQPAPNQPTERRPICGSRRTSTLFLVTWRRTATAGGRAGRQWALAAHPDPHLSPPSPRPRPTPPRVVKTAAVTRRLRAAPEVKAFLCVEFSAVAVGHHYFT